MGENWHRLVQLSFHQCWRVEFQGSRVTSDGGWVLVCELDEHCREQSAYNGHLHDLCDRARYDLRLDYAGDLNPPLPPAEATWAEQLLRRKGLR
jgi:hypothetical protein